MLSKFQEDTLLSLPPYRAAIAQCLLIAYRRGLQIRTERTKPSEQICGTESPLSPVTDESKYESLAINLNQALQKEE